MKIILNTLKYWLPLAAVITLFCGLLYATVQQSYRMGANDPQIQMAEDTARALESGQSASSLVPSGKIDIAQSLAPYLIIYDANGQPVVSNALLHNQIPTIPSGIFEYTRKNGEDRVSWQPEPGVRSATVIDPVNNGRDGFVLAGRSLREVEIRESALTTQVEIGWLVTILASLVLVGLFELLPFTRSQ
ncbi:MAG TPA: hypothetical protein VKF38_16270 [Anaerolineaceae bacterium]|nr:hypothetical protein [Anaerolineaceae bacterium]